MSKTDITITLASDIYTSINDSEQYLQIGFDNVLVVLSREQAQELKRKLLITLEDNE